MKKIILLFLVVCNCLICSSAGISKDILTANTWKVIYPDFHGNQTHIFKFNSSNTLELKVTFHFNNRTHLIYYDYYFTDVNPKTFDLEKNAGKRSGRVTTQHPCIHEQSSHCRTTVRIALNLEFPFFMAVSAME